MPAIVLQYVLKKGLTAGEDVFIDTTMQFAAMPVLYGSQGDYVIIFEPTASSMEKEGKGYGHPLVKRAEKFYNYYFAKKSTIEKNPEFRSLPMLSIKDSAVDSHTPKKSPRLLDPTS